MQLFLLGYCFFSAGEDYIPLKNETLVFDNTVFKICLDLVAIDDEEFEGIETFGLMLESNDPAVVITNGYIQVSIIDRDIDPFIFGKEYFALKY